ncbi:AAA family ATPase [Deinococcus aestuarii]|uniref:AAA family ATPase n=1 Tax=Deinococcus aestuarii TaxID=2774531 RepID=UPI001C0E2C4D|nr:AAA family ATPase [Deinococcus aestuarii]
MPQLERPTGPVALRGYRDRDRILDVQGWRRFVNRPVPPRPVMPNRETWRGWSEAQRQEFNRARHLYHANFPPIATPDLQDFHNQMLLQLWKNIDGDDGTPPGGLLDGPRTLGKTTILKWLARRFELEFTERYPAEDPAQQHLVIPVAYLGMSAGATPKDLSLGLARFFNFPLPTNTKGITRGDITAAVLEAIALHQTQLLCVDDAHFINMYTDAGRLANDHLKEITEKSRCTLIFTGIDCEGSGLLAEGRGPDGARKSQLGGRLIYKAITPMTRDGAAWTGVLADLERTLVLAGLHPGTLTDGLSDYLYDRTKGYIGPLMNLARKATRVSVDTGLETLTEPLLAGIRLDRASEIPDQPEPAKKPRKSRTSGRTR